MSITFTVLTLPAPLGKRYWLADGQLQSPETRASIVSGQYQRYTVASLKDFGAFLPTVRNDQALLYGVFAKERGSFGVIDQKASKKVEVARCREDMSWPSGPGILFLDYDPQDGRPALTRDELIGALRSSCPFLDGVELLWRPSSSSLIYHGEKLLKGIRGQRVYIAVDDASQIPRIGDTIFKRLWLSGHGRIDLSACGSELARSIVDASVWQPERYDFVGGALCDAPLSQAPLPTELLPGEKTFLLASSVAPLTSSDDLRLKEIRAGLSQKRKTEAKRKRTAYINEAAAVLVGEDQSKAALDKAKNVIKAAIDNRDLHPDFILHHRDGERVTVAQLLADPERWHMERFCDPLEPTYRGDERICVAYLLSEHQAKPMLFSHAHGGGNFFLKAAPTQPTREQPKTPGAVAFDKYGRPFVNLGNLVKALQSHPAWSLTKDTGEVRQLLSRDSLTGDIVFEGPAPWERSAAPWDDSDTRALRLWVQDEYDVTVSGQLALDIAESLADKQQIDRLKDSIEALPSWDGTERLSRWVITYLGCDDTPINRAFGRRFLIAMMARGLRSDGAKVDTVLTLVGGQGKKKSTAFNILAGSDDFFADQLGADLHQKDASSALRGLWVVELGELNPMARSQLEVVKAFLSRRIDRYREAYGRKTQNFPRRCVFVASTNNPEFLTDTTGNRRWWPLRIAHLIDIDALRRDRDQLLAEAREAYLSGEQWWLTEEEELLAQKVQNDQLEQDPWHDEIVGLIGTQTFVTVRDLLTRMDFHITKQGTQESRRVVRVLQALGWEQKRRELRGVQTRGWVAPQEVVLPPSIHDVSQKSPVMSYPNSLYSKENTHDSTSRHQELTNKKGGGVSEDTQETPTEAHTTSRGVGVNRKTSFLMSVEEDPPSTERHLQEIALSRAVDARPALPGPLALIDELTRRVASRILSGMAPRVAWDDILAELREERAAP